MSQQYPGGFITKDTPTLNPALGNSAPGIWTMDQLLQARQSNTWPAYDPYFKNTTLLLHGNGTNGAQNNTFLDSSTNNFTITRNGGTPGMTQGTFSPYGNTWSNYFDGTGDYLSAPSNAAFDFGTGDFTAEFWYCPSSISGTKTILDINYGTAPNLSVQAANGVMKVYVNGTTITITSSATDAIGSWYHYAVVRNGTTITIYRDGASVGSATYSGNVGNSTVSCFIGGSTGGGGYYVDGYLSNFRIVKGTAVYTAAFTPPTGPLTAITNTSLLTCQSNRFIDNSSNAFTLTRNGDVAVQRFSPFSPTTTYSTSVIGGSGYFDGNGDFLTVASNAAFAFGTGDYTVECWFYPLSVTDVRAIVDIGTSVWQLYTNASGQIVFYNGADRIISSAITNNAWYHIAISRASNTTKLFINGTQSGSSYTDTTNYSGPYAVGIGDNASGSINEINAYLSDIRIIKGTAQYTAAFTPPTAPLTAITNTQLLLNFTNAGIIDSAMMNNLETRGNAQISTAQSKFGGASISMPSGVTNVMIPFSQNLVLGAGDFTLEAWVNPTAVVTAQIQSIYASPVGASSYAGLIFEISAAGNFQITFSGGGGWTVLRASCGAATAGVWQHFAIVRRSLVFYVYINGIQTYTSSAGTGALLAGTTPAVIGSGRYAVDSLYYVGYIDDFRLTKGVARYTGNFTPQTSQWQDQ